MRSFFAIGRGAVLVLLLSTAALAQQPPAIGYVHPAGAAAGSTVDVTLGGYDWTPDVELFVHDPRITLELVGEPGPLLVPEPPYWFGAKARRKPFPIPREVRARLTIPADVPPGVVEWQVANANGASPVGRFVVGPATHAEVLEDENRDGPQQLPALPVVVSGRVRSIEEVDRYRFTPTRSGLVTCRLTTAAIGSELNAVVEVRDDTGRIVTTAADTTGDDLAFVLPVEADRPYEVSLYDLDFRGNRAFVYRLSLDHAPLVVSAIPATAPAGSRQKVEFVGYGLESGKPELESLVREVTFPKNAAAGSFAYSLETPHGTASPIRLFTTDLPCLVKPTAAATTLTAPVLVTDVLAERYGEKRYTFAATKGSAWSIRATARGVGSPLDVAVAVLDAEGIELARGDDAADSTDAPLDFTAKADGEYTLVVTDVAGRSGNRAAVFQLEFTSGGPGFAFDVPEVLAVPIGGTTRLTLRVARTGGFKEAITLALENPPAGFQPPEPFEIPAGKPSANLELAVEATAAATASLARLVGTATVDGRTLRHESGPVLVATTIPPPFGIDAEGQDDVTKWPRGTTFPAPVLIERNEGFDGEILLEMAANQGRHRQGIHGPELPVPPGLDRILYPVFLPEWLETTRTSRMVVNGVARVADPAGNVRHSLVRQKTRMGFLPVGGLLKLSADPGEIVVAPGDTFVVPFSIARSGRLVEPLRLELATTEPESAAFTAKPLDLDADDSTAELPITVAAEDVPPGEYRLTLRATVLQDGKYPAVSEATFVVRVEPSP